MRLRILCLLFTCCLIGACGNDQPRTNNSKLSEEKLNQIQNKATTRQQEELGAGAADAK